MQGRLLTISGVLECLTGLAFLLSPGGTIAFLLGAEPGSVGLMIGRVAGVALLSLGIACWGARADAGGAARMGTLRAITLYNAGAGLLLVLFAATGKAGGPVVWAVGVLHWVSPRRSGFLGARPETEGPAHRNDDAARPQHRSASTPAMGETGRDTEGVQAWIAPQGSRRPVVAAMRPRSHRIPTHPCSRLAPRSAQALGIHPAHHLE